MSERVEACGRCRFWQGFGSEYPETGACRRRAPQPKTAWHTDAMPEALWPQCASGDWCGEFERSAAEKLRLVREAEAILDAALLGEREQ